MGLGERLRGAKQWFDKQLNGGFGEDYIEARANELRRAYQIADEDRAEKRDNARAARELRKLQFEEAQRAKRRDAIADVRGYLEGTFPADYEQFGPEPEVDPDKLVESVPSYLRGDLPAEDILQTHRAVTRAQQAKRAGARQALEERRQLEAEREKRDRHGREDMVRLAAGLHEPRAPQRPEAGTTARDMVAAAHQAERAEQASYEGNRRNRTPWVPWSPQRRKDWIRQYRADIAEWDAPPSTAVPGAAAPSAAAAAPVAPSAPTTAGIDAAIAAAARERLGQRAPDPVIRLGGAPPMTPEQARAVAAVRVATSFPPQASTVPESLTPKGPPPAVLAPQQVQAALAKLSPEDRAAADAALATGDPRAIAEIHALLAQVR